MSLVFPVYRNWIQMQPPHALFGFLNCLCQFCSCLHLDVWAAACRVCLKAFSVCLAELPYRVAIFPSRKASAASTSANAWVTVSGTLGETSPVSIPRGALEFVFRVSEWMCSVNFCSVMVLYRDVTALFYCSTRIWASSRL